MWEKFSPEDHELDVVEFMMSDRIEGAVCGVKIQGYSPMTGETMEAVLYTEESVAVSVVQREGVDIDAPPGALTGLLVRDLLQPGTPRVWLLTKQQYRQQRAQALQALIDGLQALEAQDCAAANELDPTSGKARYLSGRAAGFARAVLVLEEALKADKQ